MTQGLYIASSGIRAAQTAIDVISNNIANVNTTSFKASKANFATTFSNTISSGSGTTLTRGGLNPIQMGSGTTLAEIAVNQTQGGSQPTGRPSDMLISGEGFFVLQDLSGNSPLGLQTTFTRAGNFTVDAKGYLVNNQGDRVVGTSFIEGSSPAAIDNIRIPMKMKVAKYMDASQNVIGTCLGQKTAPNSAFDTYATTNSITAVTTAYQEADFVSFSIGLTGGLVANYSNGDTLSVRPNPNASLKRMELLHTTNEGRIFAGVNATQANGVTGQLSGTNALITANPGGGNPMEGMTLQLQTVTFTNKQGLIGKEGNNFYIGANAGDSNFGVPGSGSRGPIQTGALETANVDMAMEFSNLVVAQRGLEANSRVIKAQSEVLQSIINSI
ncbi:MAG: flagellar hook-basal body complex protein [Vampirovibrio sp.]